MIYCHRIKYVWLIPEPILKIRENPRVVISCEKGRANFGVQQLPLFNLLEPEELDWRVCLSWLEGKRWLDTRVPKNFHSSKHSWGNGLKDAIWRGDKILLEMVLKIPSKNVCWKLGEWTSEWYPYLECIWVVSGDWICMSNGMASVSGAYPSCNYTWIWMNNKMTFMYGVYLYCIWV